MGVGNKQIGWSNESNLLWQIAKQLQQLATVIANNAGNFLKSGDNITELVNDAGYAILPYKVYTALISQSGTSAPTVIVLQNTIGNIVWTYDSVGEYIGTLTGAFTSDKVWFSLSPAPTALQKLERIDSDMINLGSGAVSTGLKTNGLYNKTSIEIRVFN